MDKHRIRQEYLLKRRQLSAGDAISKSELIRQHLLSSTDWHTIHSVHIYGSQVALREVDTSRIIEHLSANLPQIQLTIVEASSSAPIPSAKYDLIIVPVVAFDAQRNRFGFGGGWYDRFSATQPQALTIGLAYDFQQYASLPREPHDIPLKRIITESGVV